MGGQNNSKFSLRCWSMAPFITAIFHFSTNPYFSCLLMEFWIKTIVRMGTNGSNSPTEILQRVPGTHFEHTNDTLWMILLLSFLKIGAF